MLLIDVHILDTKTGERRVYQTDADVGASEWPSEQEMIDYMWSDGNYACDCNRYLFFCRAIGAPEEDNRPCGDTRYAVQIKDRATGSVIYEDDRWPDGASS